MGPRGLALRHRALLLVLVLTAAANAPSLRWPFTNDDWSLLHLFQAPHGFRTLVTPIRTPLYRPLGWGGVALQHSVFGLHPLPYHLVALAFVLGAAALVVATARRLGLSETGAAVAGVAYGVHPALAWMVGWMSAVGSPMGECFCAGALYLLLAPAPTRRAQAWAILLLLLAIASHETFAALPVVVLVLRLGRGRALRTAIPTAVVSAAIVIAQAATQVKEPATSEYHEEVLSWDVPRNMLWLLERLTGVVVARPDSVQTPHAEVVAGIAWLVLLAGGVAALRRGRPLALLGYAAAVPCTVPAALLVRQTMNPYYLELALLPFALGIGAVGETLVEALPAAVRWRALVPSLALAAALGAVVMVQYWDRSLLGHARTRQEQLLAQVRAAYGDSRPATIVVEHSQLRDSQTTYQGDLFRVLLDDPDATVIFR